MMFPLAKKESRRAQGTESAGSELEQARELYEKMRAEKEEIRQLLASAEALKRDGNEKGGDKGGFFSRIRNLTTELSEVETRMAGLTSQAESAEELRARLGSVVEVLEKIGEQDSFVNSVYEKVEQTVATLRREKGVGEILQANGDAATVLSSLESAQKRANELTDSVETVTNRVEVMQETTSVLGRKIDGIDHEMKSYSVLKEKIDGLNSLSEYVKSKIKSLENQKVVVERANEEAGKLNTLTWKINADLKQLQSKYSALEKIEKNISTVREMLDSSKAAITEIRDFRKHVDEASGKIDEMRKIDQELGGKLQAFQEQA